MITEDKSFNIAENKKYYVHVGICKVFGSRSVTHIREKLDNYVINLFIYYYYYLILFEFSNKNF